MVKHPDLALHGRTCYEPLVSTHPDTQGVALGVVTLGALTGAGCGDDGQIELTNITETDVDVRLDDEAVEEVSGSGGMVILSGECYDGPIVVTYGNGKRIQVQGPICGGQELLIGDKTAELRASRTN